MLEYVGFGCGGLLVLALIVLFVAARSHRRWLGRQSPSGAWQGSHPVYGSVLIAFDGGPQEGEYRELRTSGEESTREMGHWSALGNQLCLLIMVTDVPDHPRFGVDTLYELKYIGPQEITIDGPDRQGLKLGKAPPGIQVPIDSFTT